MLYITDTQGKLYLRDAVAETLLHANTRFILVTHNGQEMYLSVAQIHSFIDDGEDPRF
jgi:hypothetical protein